MDREEGAQARTPVVQCHDLLETLAGHGFEELDGHSGVRGAAGRRIGTELD